MLNNENNKILNKATLNTARMTDAQLEKVAGGNESTKGTHGGNGGDQGGSPSGTWYQLPPPK